MENGPAENRPSVALGIALILVATFFCVFTKDIPRFGLAGDTDPGPRAIPLAMALVVAVGGLIELARALWVRKWQANIVSAQATTDTQATTANVPLAETREAARTSYRNFTVLTAAMFVYLLALSWIGFQISTVLFSTGILSWLGARWWSALLAGVAIVFVVRVLFVGLFGVQLPDGVWRLAI